MKTTELPQNQRFALAEQEAQDKANSTGLTYYVIFNSTTRKVTACTRNEAMRLLNSDRNAISSTHDPEVGSVFKVKVI